MTQMKGLIRIKNGECFLALLSGLLVLCTTNESDYVEEVGQNKSPPTPLFQRGELSVDLITVHLVEKVIRIPPFEKGGLGGIYLSHFLNGTDFQTRIIQWIYGALY